MYGYLVADQSCLSPEQLARYKACYCGLCRSLKERHGQLSRLTLSYDLCFLVLLLSSLYEPEESSGAEPCPRHPRAPQSWVSSEISAYAADMDLVLAYLKCLDDWQDDSDLLALAQARALRAAFKRLEGSYPRQCRAIDQALEQLHEVESRGLDEADQAAACFGSLMAEVLVYKEDRWAPVLRAMGYALGRFIYLMDACMDLEKDTLRNRYNPFRRYYGLDNNEQRFRDILKMELGACVFYFDKLPLVQDVGLMQNILCRGLWSEFERKYSKNRGREVLDDTGSV